MLDERDRQILSLLQANADTPLNEIAEAVSLSPSACSRRIAKLRDDGIIQHNRAELDRSKIGLPSTISGIVSTAA
jgi:Lrp/AsnC family transcriptional regulator